jgi:hypothetical protein
MAEPTDNGGVTTPQNSNNPSGGSQPTPTAQPTGTQTFDPSKLGDKDWEAITKSDAFWDKAFQHERFKSLNEKAKKADDYEAKKSVEEEKRLVEQKKFEELATKRGEEAATYKGKYETTLVNNKVIVECQKLGVIDPDAVMSLLDRSKVKVTNDAITGVEEAVKDLITAKPYLTTKVVVPNIGGNTNPSNAATQPPRFKHSQIQDPKFFRENEKDIMNALRLGLVEDDLHLGVPRQ